MHRTGEFNPRADPETAKVVVEAEGMITFVGWELSRRFAVITPDDQQHLRELGPFGEFAVEIDRDVETFSHKHKGLDGYDLPDPLAIAVALDPDGFQLFRMPSRDVLRR